jgi:hypothetical protein
LTDALLVSLSRNIPEDSGKGQQGQGNQGQGHQGQQGQDHHGQQSQGHQDQQDKGHQDQQDQGQDQEDQGLQSQQDQGHQDQLDQVQDQEGQDLQGQQDQGQWGPGHQDQQDQVSSDKQSEDQEVSNSQGQYVSDNLAEEHNLGYHYLEEQVENHNQGQNVNDNILGHNYLEEQDVSDHSFMGQGNSDYEVNGNISGGQEWTGDQVYEHMNYMEEEKNNNMNLEERESTDKCLEEQCIQSDANSGQMEKKYFEENSELFNQNGSGGHIEMTTPAIRGGRIVFEENSDSDNSDIRIKDIDNEAHGKLNKLENVLKQHSSNGNMQEYNLKLILQNNNCI